ncbi:penicillin-binding protein 1B [Catenovulum agarivorans DS-2]|uniref:Penicillin-binding protein 1B n=1 Tax=Catenovulum agarivorans DS-2 TaxID=1328313 RepID=W7QED2_9ALTE|nr:penicillin-binding protein 1B [Catenovulum agarivorans]EWH11244.1 penicillin-binding protein 1B [Catenovulum agarivorans DS-2]
MAEKKASWLARGIKLAVKLILVAVVLFVAYGVYLDAQIKQKFSGNKWQLPALVYGMEHEYFQTDALYKDDLIRHLNLLDYRKVRAVSLPGEYKVHANAVELVRREYSLAENHYRAKRLKISFQGRRIKSIWDFGAQQSVSAFTLEPYLLARLQANNLEDRILVSLENVPDIVIQTLLLVEDRSFYEHHGVSPLAILRALWVNIQAGRTVQGGSTLTQQLVKNMFLTNERSLVRKLKEAYLALLLDARYDKHEILQAYINEVYVGQNHQRAVHGLGLASQFYFAKPLNELSANEIALLVGMIKGPSYYNPRKYPQRAKERRDLILRLMTAHGLLTPDDYQVEVSRKLTVQDLNAIARRKFPAYVDQVREELKNVVTHDSQLFSGLKIYTHFDPLAQHRAQTSLSTSVELIENRRNIDDLQGAIVVVDSQQGGIKALVGDKKPHYAGFNRALNAQRNIGSLVKPFVYISAFEQDPALNLASIVKDQAITLTSSLGNQWSPKNYDKKYEGDIRLLDALVRSRNVPAVNLGMQTGLREIADRIQDFGIQREIPVYPSLLLGSVTLSPFEVAQIYQVLANKGTYIQLHAIRSIYSNDNQQVWQPAEKSYQVVDASYSYLINYALHKVTREGTAKAIAKSLPNRKFAGKTGTTNDGRDSWFVGYDHNELALVWLGRDDNQAISLTGSAGALKTFIQYQQSHNGENLILNLPAGVELKYFDKQTGLHSLPGCENLLLLPAIVEHLPPAKACDGSKEWVKPKSTWLERLFDW